MKCYLLSTLVALILTLLGGAFSPTLYAETWYITSLDWQPYSDSKAKDQGLSVKKLREILKTEGIDLIVEFYPWLRSQALAQNTKYVGYFPAWPEEVNKGFIASTPVGSSNIGLLANHQYSSPETDFKVLFKKNKICTVKTYVYPQIITQLLDINSHNKKSYLNEEAMVRALSNNLCTLAISDPKVMLFNAKKQGIKNLKVIQSELLKKALVVSLRNQPDNYSKIKRLNSAIRRFNRSP
ncbi:MAG: hypothetical protein V7785_08245 [Bermanella sp.]